MKMHTFFMSGKAIALVAGALGAGGTLMFVSGVLVGVRLQLAPAGQTMAMATAPAAAPGFAPAMAGGGASTAAGPTAGTPEAGPTATPGATAPAPPPAAAPGNQASPMGAPSAATGASAQVSTTAEGAWPFTRTNPDYAPPVMARQDPTWVPGPTPVPTTPTAPAAPAVTHAVTQAVGMVTAANTAPVRLTPGAMDGNAEDASSYLVQVGTFRVEAHARELATRLAAAGYSATVSTREEGDRELHVVRVGRFAGRQAAEHVAARIGDAEQLVASIVATPGRN